MTSLSETVFKELNAEIQRVPHEAIRIVGERWILAVRDRDYELIASISRQLYIPRHYFLPALRCCLDPLDWNLFLCIYEYWTKHYNIEMIEAIQKLTDDEKLQNEIFLRVAKFHQVDPERYRVVQPQETPRPDLGLA